MTNRVTAIFDDRTKAIDAVNSLETLGCKKDDISFLVSSNSWNGKDIKIEENSKAPEGATFGAGLGGLTGAVLGGMTAVGTVALTGGAGLLAAGPIVGSLAGAAAGGATGGIIGGLIGSGIPETEAKFVDERLGKGHVMVAVETPDDKAQLIEKLLKDKHADKVTIQ